MKNHHILNIILIAIAALFALKMSASDTQVLVYNIPLHQIANDENDDEKDIKNHRSLSRPIFCTISLHEGLYISGVDQSEILGYEVKDEYDSNSFSFTNENEFINYINQMVAE